LEIFAILIGVVILAALGFYIGRPLVQSRRTATSYGADALSLEMQRESLYTQIKEPIWITPRARSTTRITRVCAPIWWRKRPPS
jgi:hypothetical protein